ncbi:MAG: hypothetical protein Q7T26_08625 [Dehalococcoidia bacterium]|nr:hypothetical protein [Dehalococcoidia bacterium]
MHLSGLLPLVREALGYPDVARRLARAPSSGQATVSALAIAAARPAVIAALLTDVRAPVMLVTPSPEDSQRLQEQVELWLGPERPVLRLPEPDGMPYERLLADPATVRDRLRALAALVCRLCQSRPDASTKEVKRSEVEPPVSGRQAC